MLLSAAVPAAAFHISLVLVLISSVSHVPLGEGLAGCWAGFGGCGRRCPFLLVLTTGTWRPSHGPSWTALGSDGPCRSASLGVGSPAPASPGAPDTIPVLPVGPELLKHPAAAGRRPASSAGPAWLSLSLVPTCFPPCAFSKPLSISVYGSSSPCAPTHPGFPVWRGSSSHLFSDFTGVLRGPVRCHEEEDRCPCGLAHMPENAGTPLFIKVAEKSEMAFATGETGDAIFCAHRHPQGPQAPQQ